MTKLIFDKEEKYKLYRNISELLHPSISKKNISNYKIIIDEDMYPIRVFYPKKVSNLEKIIIYIHGDPDITSSNGKYSQISEMISKYANQLVISIDYYEKDLEFLYKKIYKNVKKIYKELLKNNISPENITLVGDSTGGSIVLYLYKCFLKDNIEIKNIILFYPVLSGEYYGKTKYNSLKEKNVLDYRLIEKLGDYYKPIKSKSNLSQYFHLKSRLSDYNKIDVVCGKADPLLDEIKEFSNRSKNIDIKIIDFANHGFLKSNDKEIKKELKSILTTYNND